MTGSGRHWICATAAATEAVGEWLATNLDAGDIVLLEGDLAAGKTTLVRGLLRGLGGDPDDVSSPTFVLVQSYPCSALDLHVLHHVDLYRLAGSTRELRELGLEEMASQPGSVMAVEWPRGELGHRLPPAARVWRIRLAVAADGRREITAMTPEPPSSRSGAPRHLA